MNPIMRCAVVTFRGILMIASCCLDLVLMWADSVLGYRPAQELDLGYAELAFLHRQSQRSASNAGEHVIQCVVMFFEGFL